MNNILTIDLEEWFHANYHRDIVQSNSDRQIRVVNSTYKLLKLFRKYKAKATFFVLGYVAEKHPQLIRDIFREGHELASHGYSHELVYNQTRKEFKEDLIKSIAIIQELINYPVKGYRAPSWSITEKSMWAWEVLEELELLYDASVFPIKTFLYGLPSAPRFMYHPVYNNKKLNLMEIPSSTIKVLGLNIPFAGGFYFRVLPSQLIAYGIRQVNKETFPAIVYLHPREIDPDQPRLVLSHKETFIHYYGIQGCQRKLEKILCDFEFTTISSFYELDKIM